MPTGHSEHVLVVPTELLHALGYFQGFTSDIARYLEELLAPGNTSYGRRGQVENDPRFKQLIQYAIFRYTDLVKQSYVFQYLRGQGQDESRLRGKRSIGVGGHISLADVASAEQHNPYYEGMWRELREEVTIETALEERCVGLINDDTNEVGQVHLGVVHLVDVREPAVQPRESGMLEASFQPIHCLVAKRAEFETWSQICLDGIFSASG